MQIYISRNGQSFGPYSVGAVRSYLAEGKVLPSDLAWFDGADGWGPLARVPGLFDPNPAPPLFPNQNQLPSPPPIPASLSTSANQPARNDLARLIVAAVIAVAAVVLMEWIIEWVEGDAGISNQHSTRPELLSKAEWRAKITKHYGMTAQLGIVQNWRVSDFKSLMGEPSQTQTIGENAYWDYRCSDGLIQLELFSGSLPLGLMQGRINDF